MHSNPSWKKPKGDFRLTVLMPVKNAEKTIGAAIRSTLFALPRNGFLYLYLDACSDKTEEIVKGIFDSRLRIYHGTQSRGVAGSLNFLLDQVETPLIARMDADDLCLPSRFKTQARLMKKTEADFVFLNAILFGPSIRPCGFLPQPPAPIRAIDSARVLAECNPFVHPTMMAKTAALKKLGGYVHSPAEDYHLWLDASISGMKLVRGRAFGILYRVHKGQLTKQSSWRAALEKDELLAQKISVVSQTVAFFEQNTRVSYLRETWSRKIRRLVSLVSDTLLK